MSALIRIPRRQKTENEINKYEKISYIYYNTNLQYTYYVEMFRILQPNYEKSQIHYYQK